MITDLNPDIRAATAALNTVNGSLDSMRKPFPPRNQRKDASPAKLSDLSPQELAALAETAKFSNLGNLWADLIAGKLVITTPTVSPVSATRCLFYPAALNEVHAEPGLGKTNLVAAAGIAEVKAGGTWLYIDPEDTPAGFTTKLAELSGSDPEIGRAFVEGRIRYCHNPEPDELVAQAAWAIVNRPTLVALDGLAELMAADGCDEDCAKDVLTFFRRRIRPFAELAGAAVVISDHVVKNAKGGTSWARGSGAKKGRYDGVSYELQLGQPYSPSVAGYIKVIVSKDRKGGVGPKGSHVCNLHFKPVADCKPVPDAGGTTRPLSKLRMVNVQWENPADAPPFEPTCIMGRIVEYLTTMGPATETDACTGRGTHRTKALPALALLVRKGIIVQTINDKGKPVYDIANRGQLSTGFDPGQPQPPKPAGA